MRLTKFNEETGQYEYIEKAKTLAEYRAQRKAAIQKLGEFEDKASEVAEEIFAEIEKTFKECLWFLENHPSNYPTMDRTKINVYKDNLQYIAEIKNKYKGE
jgi:hypothetical protein